MRFPEATPLVEALARPESYGNGVEDVEVRETHISWVFLAGDRAYKLKKPVVLPFLDYGTPQKRRQMCDQEVRLNSRLAADLYLGVRAVLWRDGHAELGDPGSAEALDYVVEMRRYEQGATLAATVKSGALKESQMVTVAERLAAFHADARRVPAAARPARVVARLMNENFHELLAILEEADTVGSVLELERFTHAFVGAHGELLAARARNGLAREVHGDLRAEHVVLDPTLQIVDCVEFSRELREMDVADELAFLVMDMTALGGERFAQTLTLAYRAAGGDPGEDWLIAFYASYRALVRAKVALLRSAQDQTPGAQERHRDEASRLIAVAERFAWRARLPLVIVVCGLPATGKSTVASALAEVAGLAHLSSDLTRKRLAGVAALERADARFYTPEFNRQTYAELGRIAADETAGRGGAIVDATFRHRSDREAFAEGLARVAPTLFVECRVPDGVLAGRAADRDRLRRSSSDATLEVVLRERGSWEPLDEVPPESHLTLRSDRPVDAQLMDLRALLDRRLGHLEA